MGYAESKKITVEEIPIIDFSGFQAGNEKDSLAVAQQIRNAAKEVGFFYIRNHGISESVIQKAHQAAKLFFSQPSASKRNLKINSNHHGFLSVGEAQMESAEKIEDRKSVV